MTTNLPNNFYHDISVFAKWSDIDFHTPVSGISGIPLNTN